jgi:molybdenum cofactor biosynthesis protein A
LSWAFGGEFRISRCQMGLKDSYKRSIDYARISLTDKCNLRCRYCMPAEGISFLKNQELLSTEEVLALCESLHRLGIKKVRFTGGEPLVRPDFKTIFEKASSLFPSVHITSNGSLVRPLIPFFKKHGLKSINISLDTLDANRFFLITRRDEYEEVWAAIHELMEAGIQVKINMVVLRGINEHEIQNFIALAKEKPLEVRFIEVMPFNDLDGNVDQYVSFQDIKSLVMNYMPELTEWHDGKRSTYLYSSKDLKGEIGIIPAYTRSLCHTCNRIRINAKGELLTCLYSAKGYALRPFIKDSHALEEALRKAVFKKELNGNVAEKERTNHDVFESMTTIGG